MSIRRGRFGSPPRHFKTCEKRPRSSFGQTNWLMPRTDVLIGQFRLEALYGGRIPQRRVPMADSSKPRLIGFNHVAIEVGDLEEALAFYGKLFDFELRRREPGMAFIDLGDQFLALQETPNPSPTGGRHFGLVVEDKEAARRRIVEAGIP